MRVAHIVPSLEERHGGPSKSVRALANALAAHLPTDLLTTHEPGQPIATAQKSDLVNLHVFARDFPRSLCRSRGLLQRLRHTRYDCVHHHSLWLLTLRYSRETAAAHKAALVISPRGMLSEWAYHHHRLRKQLAARFVHPGAFAAAAGWHVTSREEADDVRRLGFRQPICIAPNGVELPAEEALAQARHVWEQRCPILAQRRVALFYSRFHRKKRVRELIELWARKPRDDWFLLLVGVPEEYSVAEIDGWLASAELREHAAVFDGRNAPAPFAVASLFVLPTHSENFGLAIAEALAAGVPALVTNTTPWAELESRGAGWCVPWDNFDAALRHALALSPEDLTAAGRRGRSWMSEAFTWEQSARLLVDFYASLRHA